MAPDTVGGLGLLRGIHRNAYGAFPRQCLDTPVFLLGTPFMPIAVVSAPDAIRHVMLDHHADYGRLPMGRRVLSPIVGNGLIVSEGAAWKRQRRAMAPAFTPQKMHALTGLIIDVAEDACQALHGNASPDITDSTETTDLFDFFQSASLDIGARVMFSSNVSSADSELRRLLNQYMTKIGAPAVSDFLLPPWMPTPLSIRRDLFRRQWRRMMLAIVADRRKSRHAPTDSAAHSSHRADLFDLLSEAHGGTDEALLLDEVSTMLVAGHETTALTLFWACTLLARSPDWQSAVAQEAGAFDWETARRTGLLPDALPITRAVVKETLRLYSPAYMTARLAAKDHCVSGHDIPKGAMVIVPFWLLHRNPSRWRAPQAFDPSRFMSAQEPDRFDYLPFGIGPHVCIGAQLALTESIIVLARMFATCRVGMLGQTMPLPVGRLSTRPSYRPRFVVERRAL